VAMEEAGLQDHMEVVMDLVVVEGMEAVVVVTDGKKVKKKVPIILFKQDPAGR